MPDGTLPQAPAGSLLGPQSYAPPQMTQAGTLPSITGGLDQSQLQDLFKDLVPTTSMEDYRRAMTPVAQRTPMSMQGFYQPPVQRPGPVQLDERPVVGAGNARGQGITNTISASINALAQFKAAHDEHKQAADANKVATYIDATNKLQQAQQMFQQLAPNDPQRAELQKVISSNSSLIQGMSSDPKFVKTLEKGFNISLTDPSQNKTPDHNIVKRGLALFQSQRQQPLSPQAAQGVAQRFQQSQPMGLGPNVQAQQELQIKQAIDQGKAAMAKERMDYYKAQLEYKGKVDVADIQKFTELQKVAMQDNSKWNLAVQKFGFDSTLAAYDRNTRLMVEDAKAGPQNFKTNMELFNKASETYQKSMEGLNKQAMDLTAKLATEKDQGRINEYRGQQRLNQEMQDTTRNQFNSAMDIFCAKAGIPRASIQEAAPPKVGAGIPDAGPQAQGQWSTDQPGSTWDQLLKMYFGTYNIAGSSPGMGRIPMVGDLGVTAPGPDQPEAGPKFGDTEERNR